MKETIIQFGTGNFLRAFICQFIDTLNKKGLYEGKIVIVQPTRGGKTDIINEQNGKYNLFLRGIKNGGEVSEHTEINSVSRGVDPYSDYDAYLSLAENPDMRFIISNTTEAGISFDESCSFEDKPALSFPGKLTQLLYHRYKKGLDGFIILPCELIDNNGDVLKSCVMKYAEMWNLGEGFMNWINEYNVFSNTLVDRIVTGYPKDEAEKLNRITGYDDKLLDTAEIFHLWVIEGNFEDELPLKRGGMNVIWTENVSPYKKMKVRILNGSHTSLVFPSLLCGVESVGESLKDEDLREYLDVCLSEYILPVLGETEENKAFAAAVLERFGNPYIRHLWKSISLNSISKFTARVLPTITDYMSEKKSAPVPLLFALACLIEYYKNNDISDDEKAVAFIRENNVGEILAENSLWGADLSIYSEIVSGCLHRIREDGIREAMKWAIS